MQFRDAYSKPVSLILFEYFVNKHVCHFSAQAFNAFATIDRIVYYTAINSFFATIGANKLATLSLLALTFLAFGAFSLGLGLVSVLTLNSRLGLLATIIHAQCVTAYQCLNRITHALVAVGVAAIAAQRDDVHQQVNNALPHRRMPALKHVAERGITAPPDDPPSCTSLELLLPLPPETVVDAVPFVVEPFSALGLFSEALSVAEP